MFIAVVILATRQRPKLKLRLRLKQSELFGGFKEMFSISQGEKKLEGSLCRFEKALFYLPKIEWLFS